MEHKFSYHLSSLENEQIRKCLDASGNHSIEMLPGWQQNTWVEKTCYHQFFSGGQLVAFAAVVEKFGRMARLQFGPKVSFERDLAQVIIVLAKHYKANSFWELYIQLFQIRDFDKSNIQLHYESVFNKQSWSTIHVNLGFGDILGNISKRQQRLIQKSKKLDVRDLDFSEVNVFVGGMQKMLTARGLPFGPSKKKLLKHRLELSLLQKRAIVKLVTLEDKIVGGVFFVDQGDHWFYQSGFADPEFRKIPILHNAFYLVFLQAQAEGKSFVDLGGYNKFALENEQIHNINLFKIGFSKNVIDYQPQLIFEFAPVKLKIIKHLAKVFKRN